MSDRLKFRVYDTALKSYRTDMYIGADGNLFYFHDGRMDKVTGDRWIVEKCTFCDPFFQTNADMCDEYDPIRTNFDRLASSVDDMAAAMVHASWGVVDGEQEVIGYTSRFDPEIHDTENQAIKAAIQLLLEAEE